MCRHLNRLRWFTTRLHHSADIILYTGIQTNWFLMFHVKDSQLHFSNLKLHGLDSLSGAVISTQCISGAATLQQPLRNRTICLFFLGFALCVNHMLVSRCKQTGRFECAMWRQVGQKKARDRARDKSQDETEFYCPDRAHTAGRMQDGCWISR